MAAERPCGRRNRRRSPLQWPAVNSEFPRNEEGRGVMSRGVGMRRRRRSWCATYRGRGRREAGDRAREAGGGCFQNPVNARENEGEMAGNGAA